MMKPEYKNQLKKFLPLALITLLFGLAFIQIIPGNGSQAEETSPVMGDFATVKTIAVLAFVFFCLLSLRGLPKSILRPWVACEEPAVKCRSLKIYPFHPNPVSSW